ncbi:hypothetical protein CC78DRAFT_581087 [Lojkania enalia]|uniref:Uncharacterized protein n=1 Tax=Lojkania enalia TaxID=147567 RepID=A0A9P4K7W2_9PLEO|nr:hypothetical protein CC78DRAFT_581087 [Didymosphaeria enalia]
MREIVGDVISPIPGLADVSRPKLKLVRLQPGRPPSSDPELSRQLPGALRRTADESVQSPVRGPPQTSPGAVCSDGGRYSVNRTNPYTVTFKRLNQGISSPRWMNFIAPNKNMCPVGIFERRHPLAKMDDMRSPRFAPSPCRMWSV